MNNILLQQVRARARQAGQRFNEGVRKYWLRVMLLVAATYLAHEKDLAIDLQLSNIPASLQVAGGGEPPITIRAQPAGNAPYAGNGPEEPVAMPASYGQAVNVSNLANTYSNLSDNQKGIRSSEDAAARAEKRRKQLRYVKRYAKVAQGEMEKYGIPASITLAQGLLESNVGESSLATKNRNHFGIKCFSRSCKKGHCSNFTDDSHKDFFRIYKSAWDSYRAHSLLLKGSERYGHLFRLGSRDYRAWAHGLARAGYATDKQYGQKLVNLIEDLGLHEYD